MNELTFLLAVLINKNVITEHEAKLLKISLDKSVINGNLKEMTAKVEEAFKEVVPEITTIDAKNVL